MSKNKITTYLPLHPELKQKRGDRSPSDEDITLFRKAVSLIQTLSQKEKTDPESMFVEIGYLSDNYQIELEGSTPLSYIRSAIEKNQLNQFKRGLLPIEGRLDLHGNTIEEAKTKLVQFFQHHLSLKHRVLLVIHGKGKHGKTPTLKNHLNHWLPQLTSVLAFVSAQVKDGGTGAVYVLLKRDAYS